jgi:hypothetical protein
MKNSAIAIILSICIAISMIIVKCDDTDDTCPKDGVRRCMGNDAQVCEDGYWETKIKCGDHDMVCCDIGRCRAPGGCEK